MAVSGLKSITVKLLVPIAVFTVANDLAPPYPAAQQITRNFEQPAGEPAFLLIIRRPLKHFDKGLLGQILDFDPRPQASRQKTQQPPLPALDQGAKRLVVHCAVSFIPYKPK